MTTTFNFWQDHSANYLEMALNGDFRERISHPDGYGRQTRGCGDTIEIFLTLDQGRIQAAAFDTNGCIHSHACANTVVHMAQSKNVDQAWRISAREVAEFLETLPENEFHCAELAVAALRQALMNLQEHRQAPWKKMYQKPR